MTKAVAIGALSLAAGLTAFALLRTSRVEPRAGPVRPEAASCTLVGTVLDAGGTPVPGARVHARILERGPADAGDIVERAEQILRDAEHPPTVAGLARTIGVHRVHLARLFRAAHGCGVAAYRRRLQVFRVARCLAGPTPLAWIATDCGFADQSHMCRAFREEFGLTPGAFRRFVRD